MNTADEQYRVLYTDADGHEQLTGSMTYDQAYGRARDLDSRGYAVGSVMTSSAAEQYMQDRYSPTYRSVPVPKGLRDDGVARHLYESWKRGVDQALDKEKPARVPAAEDPFAPDLTMSRDVADFILRAVNGLLLEGYYPKGYDVLGRHGGTDDPDFDTALVLKAVDIIGRERVASSHLQRFISGLMDEAPGGGTT